MERNYNYIDSLTKMTEIVNQEDPLEKQLIDLGDPDEDEEDDV